MEIVEYQLDSEKIKKNKSNDRVLVLERMPGQNTKNTLGITDNRLFTGDNKLHARFDPEYSMWYMQFESGLLPPAFKQRFTTFRKLLDFATDYYKKRNILIKEVLD